MHCHKGQNGVKIYYLQNGVFGPNIVGGPKVAIHKIGRERSNFNRAPLICVRARYLQGSWPDFPTQNLEEFASVLWDQRQSTRTPRIRNRNCTY
jgi:hypothetical protein